MLPRGWNWKACARSKRPDTCWHLTDMKCPGQATRKDGKEMRGLCGQLLMCRGFLLGDENVLELGSSGCTAMRMT